MPDVIAGITIPTIEASGTFPLKPDFPYSVVEAYDIATHTFGSNNAKTEQRFLIGTGARVHTFRRNRISFPERDALVDFWLSQQGVYGAFTYNAPNPDGTTTPKVCRFTEPILSLEALRGALGSAVGLTFTELPEAPEVFALSATVLLTEVAGSLQTALQAAFHKVIPLLVITPLDTAVAPIYLSDRRVTIGGQAYIPRLLEWAPITQTIGSSADSATFTLGNADRIMTAVANVCDLYRADVQLSLFHVGALTKINVWRGHSIGYISEEGNPIFTLKCADGLYELNLSYPPREPSRTCGKPYDNATGLCPFAASGSLDLVNFPSADAGSCDRGYLTPNGCAAHRMQAWFGGLPAMPQGVYTRDNSSGTWGFGKSPLTSVSQIADSIYNQTLQEVWCDLRVDIADTSRGLPVLCKLIALRDEGDFLNGLGVVSVGPIHEFAQSRGGATAAPVYTSDPGAPNTGAYSSQTLDGKAPHGWPKNLQYGLRRSHGHDPASNYDPDLGSDQFSLSEGGAGVQRYGVTKAGGIAFCEIRVSDTSGLQVSSFDQHAMQCEIRAGIPGFQWSAPGVRTFGPTANVIWVAVNMLLRGKALQNATAAQQEAHFDVAAAIAMAEVCANRVIPLFGAGQAGSGTEPQFTFNATITESKALRDQLTEVLTNCLGFWLNSFGKVRFGIRYNSSAAQAFTAGNMIYKSLRIEPARPSFNRFTSNFGDQEFGFIGNSVVAQDITHAARIGGDTGPRFEPTKINLSGTSTKSQAGRIAVTRLREELGGTLPVHWAAHKTLIWKTSILGLASQVGMVVSVDNPDMPDYAAGDDRPFAANHGECRLQSWTINKDYSLDLVGKSTRDEMYDYTVGDKPMDVDVPIVPTEVFPPANWSYTFSAANGKIRLGNFSCGSYGDSVTVGFFNIFYVNEATAGYCRLVGDIDAVATSINWQGTPPVDGAWILIGSEILLVVSSTYDDFSSGTSVVERGAAGTTAAAHSRITATVASVSPSWANEFTVAAGLGLKAGQGIIADDSSQSRIAEYDSTTGLVRTVLPITTAAAESVYADPRIWNVEIRTEAVAFAPGFFRSPDRSSFAVHLSMPMAGIILVVGRLQNRAGQSSGWLPRLFNTAFPFRLPSGDNTSFVFTHPATPAGETLNLFQRAEAPEPQSFDGAYAEVLGLADPVDAPRAPAQALATGVSATGSLQIWGAASLADSISVSVAGANAVTAQLWVARDRGITGASSTTDVAVSLAAWLNADPVFASDFSAIADGNQVNITDLTNAGGTLAGDVSDEGTLSIIAAGFTSRLGVLAGRRYALAYADTVNSYESSAGPLSESTGPTGDSTRVDLAALPLSLDPHVNKIRVYASPDGEAGPLRLVAEVDNTGSGGITSAVDTTTEADLASQPLQAAVQPALAGDVFLHAFLDGSPWFDLRINATNGPRSNTVAAWALGPAAAGSVISFNVDNGAGDGITLKAVLL